MNIIGKNKYHAFSLVEACLSFILLVPLLCLAGGFFQYLHHYQTYWAQRDFYLWHSAMIQIDRHNLREYYIEQRQLGNTKALHFWDPKERRTVVYWHVNDKIYRCRFENGRYKGRELLLYSLKSLKWHISEHEICWKGKMKDEKNYCYIMQKKDR